MLQAYDEGRLDRLYVVSNKFINTMSQVPTLTQMLPLPASEDDELKQKARDYLYEPDPKPLLDTLLRRYVESQVYQGVVENLASEQAARMVAMKAATDNGGSLIKELQLVYNKARQASITQELTEIVSGPPRFNQFTNYVEDSRWLLERLSGNRRRGGRRVPSGRRTTRVRRA